MAQISSGQAQWLQIACALVQLANILILDECTSALDTNRAAVLQMMMDAMARCTTVMIMHKLPVMHVCDRIVVLQDSRIAEQGTYEQLMERNGMFVQLANG